MDRLVILFTMKGCPHCENLKEKLNEQNLEFFERDIHEHEDEYNLFSEITENEYVPAFMIIENSETNPKSYYFAPGNGFESLEEGVEIIKNKMLL